MKRQRQWVTFSLARYSAFRYPLPLGSAFGSGKTASKLLDTKVRKKSRFRKKSGLSGCGGRTRTYGLRVMRQSQAQIGVISAPICAFYRHSFGEFSIVSVQACPLFSCSGSKEGQYGILMFFGKPSIFVAVSSDASVNNPSSVSSGVSKTDLMLTATLAQDAMTVLDSALY